MIQPIEFDLETGECIYYDMVCDSCGKYLDPPQFDSSYFWGCIMYGKEKGWGMRKNKIPIETDWPDAKKYEHYCPECRIVVKI